jgi:hypothetical protein
MAWALNAVAGCRSNLRAAWVASVELGAWSKSSEFEFHPFLILPIMYLTIQSLACTHRTKNTIVYDSIYCLTKTLRSRSIVRTIWILVFTIQIILKHTRITIQHMIENTKGEFWEVARILRLVHIGTGMVCIWCHIWYPIEHHQVSGVAMATGNSVVYI